MGAAVNASDDVPDVVLTADVPGDSASGGSCGLDGSDSILLLGDPSVLVGARGGANATKARVVVVVGSGAVVDVVVGSGAVVVVVGSGAVVVVVGSGAVVDVVALL
jgi:transcriptional regulator of nitric oxide reductase